MAGANPARAPALTRSSTITRFHRRPDIMNTDTNSSEPDDEPFTDAEIEKLEDLLDAPNFDQKAFPVDALQGFLCAVLSGPRVIAADQWIPVVLGGTPRYASDEQADAVEALLVRFHDALEAELRADDGLSLILYPVEEGASELDYANWALGYLEGVELGEPDWTDIAGDDDMNDLLMPFLVLGGELARSLGKSLNEFKRGQTESAPEKKIEKPAKPADVEDEKKDD